MGKSDKNIIVVDKNILFGEDYFQGFVPSKGINYEERILKNLKVMRRGSTSEPKEHPLGNAELDENHKQPVGYMMIVNPSTKEVFAYQRSSKDPHYNEKRLQGNWSWGVGGHIDLEDGTENPIKESRLRELSEEIFINGEIKNVNPIGYINDDSNSVGKVHFGILYVVEIEGEARPKDNEMSIGEMLTIRKLEEICNSEDCTVETWSQIALSPLKEYLK